MAAATFPEYSADPGTSSVAHLRQNLAAGELQLPPDALETLNTLVGRSLN
jgi:aryl-alcohol dehydrogenase-like predicted oxidoreductase